MNLTKHASLAFIFAASMAFTSCKNEPKEDPNKMEMDQKAADEAALKEQQMKDEQIKKEARDNSIAAKAMASDDLDTLVIALKDAGLDSMMMESGEYTVFAPTDLAFGKLKKKDLTELLLPENKEMLTGVLQYHVVQGKVTAQDLAKGIADNKGKFTFKTVNDQELTAMMDGDQIVIKDGTNKRAHILQGNIEASNGLIHKIDKVLMTKG